MERPALTRLLDDIDAGQVQVVVVYKVDRLTRALTGFAKMIERFDASGTSFIAVTQQFNTTTSMGRLTLNVLLSFAQFEREVTGGRICCERVFIDFPVKQGTFRKFGQLDPRIRPLHSDEPHVLVTYAGFAGAVLAHCVTPVDWTRTRAGRMPTAMRPPMSSALLRRPTAARPENNSTCPWRVRRVSRSLVCRLLLSPARLATGKQGANRTSGESRDSAQRRPLR